MRVCFTGGRRDEQGSVHQFPPITRHLGSLDPSDGNRMVHSTVRVSSVREKIFIVAIDSGLYTGYSTLGYRTYGISLRDFAVSCITPPSRVQKYREKLYIITQCFRIRVYKPSGLKYFFVFYNRATLMLYNNTLYNGRLFSNINREL